jgi:2-(1,2-epoxy-1,2-dihydrophenyl)acetyl-CoA isomerase
MQYEQITFETRGHVGLITLNRPEKLNAWTGQMMSEMRQAMDSVADDPAVGAIVVTGSGRAFCAGADISVFADNARKQDEGAPRQAPAAAPAEPAENWVRYIQRYPKPTIAAINGAAVGIGITQILPFDIRIAGEAARIGFFFIKMGLVPELASSHLLPQMVGISRATEWCLTGRLIGAAEAREAGLVAEVVANDGLLARALELGESIANQSAPAMLSIRELLLENAHDPDLDSVMNREGVALQQAYASWQHREAIAAFFEKRPADFSKGKPG